MHVPPSKPKVVSRRQLLKQLSAAPLLLKAAPLFAHPVPCAAGSVLSGDNFLLAGSRYRPHYPVGSPLEDVLALVSPERDGFVTEVYADEIGLVLQAWSEAMRRGDLASIQNTLDPALQTSGLAALRETSLRQASGLRSVRRTFPEAMRSGGAFLQEFAGWIGPQASVASADFAITSLDTAGTSPLTAECSVRYSVVTHSGENREHSNGRWLMSWRKQAGSAGTSAWRLSRFQAIEEIRATLQGPGFVDVTRQALGGTSSYTEQLMRGTDGWRTVLDGACGIDVYGNNGIAAGDFDGDGRDDLYVSQPAGLPNRLYRNRGDGSFEDVTEKAGVGVLDNAACALFADFRNSGRQDLLVVCGSGPLLFLNQGDGTFALKEGAFRFAQPPLGTFTHAALADYDRDGKLDVYFCLYSYYLGLDQYHYPAPYFDARNGPPNFLMQNQGDGTFVDRTAASGLTAENDRYSFACAWGTVDGSGAPDLYVVNDFGRNNLYRNRGDGTFQAVSEAAGVQDVGAGMSASWADIDNDGLADLYAANMWSAAGQRVSQQAQFHAAASPAVRDLYRRHATGNALYRNQGGGTFHHVSEAAGADLGRWAWCSDFWDFDHDGYTDLYVTNGYITAAGAEPLSADTTARRGDLDSFFWRQIVGRSPENASPSPGYERGWNALNELIRSDSAWNGAERNVFLANNGDGTFCDVAGALGMDFLEDGRSFALADFDGDGRLEVVVKNRNAPQLRVLHNGMHALGDSVALRLRGTKSNRDAIGTKVVLQAGTLHQTRWLQAGSGFLAQHTKELFFGLGNSSASVTATVHWPSGLVQTFAEIPRNARVNLVEGQAAVQATPFGPTAYATAPTPTPATPALQVPAAFSTWLLDPLEAPGFRLPDQTGATVSLDSMRGSAVLLHLWSTTATGYADQLAALSVHAKGTAGLQVVALNMDVGSDPSRTAVSRLRLAIPVLFATEAVAGVYNIIFRYLFDRRADLPLPVSFLLDRDGMIVKVYQGPLQRETVLADVDSIPRTPGARVKAALPFPGTLHHGDFRRNDFTYGVAMFQHGYLDEAAASFQQVLRQRPDDAEAHYNLGTLSLRRNDLEQAQQHLQRTVELKPVYPEAWNNLGMIAAQQNHPDGAVRNFQRALEQRPGYVTALVNLGNLYRHERDYANAQTNLTRALQLEPNDPETNYSLGMLSAQQDDLATASTYLKRALELRPAYPEALNNYGVLLVRQRQLGAAEQQFQTGVRLAPGYEGSYLNLARLYVLQQQKAKARAALQDLLRVHPESKAALSALQTLDQLP